MARAEYRALRTIQHNGVNAYHEGDAVYADVVENLELVVGEDVEPSGEQVMAKPTKNARRAEWEAYARDQGMPQDEIDSLNAKDLAAKFDESAPAPAPEEPAEE